MSFGGFAGPRTNRFRSGLIPPLLGIRLQRSQRRSSVDHIGLMKCYKSSVGEVWAFSVVGVLNSSKAFSGYIQETLSASCGIASRSIRRNFSCLELHFRAGIFPLPSLSLRLMTLFRRNEKRRQTKGEQPFLDVDRLIHESMRIRMT